MVDGTFQATLADGQEEWVNKWEELTGIELEVIQPDHNAYYDVLGQTFASGPENWPCLLYTSSPERQEGIYFAKDLSEIRKIIENQRSNATITPPENTQGIGNQLG